LQTQQREHKHQQHNSSAMRVVEATCSDCRQNFGAAAAVAVAAVALTPPTAQLQEVPVENSTTDTYPM
jgi:hypothetical protein